MYFVEDEYKEDQVQAELVGVMTTKNGTINYLSVTTAYVPISLDTVVDYYVLTI